MASVLLISKEVEDKPKPDISISDWRLRARWPVGLEDLLLVASSSLSTWKLDKIVKIELKILKQRLVEEEKKVGLTSSA